MRHSASTSSRRVNSVASPRIESSSRVSNGRISKQEWMKFMEAEFDRLDKAKTGYLDVNELMQSKLRVSHFSSVGK